jgi:hypothetical protein
MFEPSEIAEEAYWSPPLAGRLLGDGEPVLVTIDPNHVLELKVTPTFLWVLSLGRLIRTSASRTVFRE